jgi:hypothetical protein
VKPHDPAGTPLEAVVHYEEQGSPFVTVTVLEDAIYVHAVQPDRWAAIEATPAEELPLLSLAQIACAERSEAEL